MIRGAQVDKGEQTKESKTSSCFSCLLVGRMCELSLNILGYNYVSACPSLMSNHQHRALTSKRLTCTAFSLNGVGPSFKS